MNAKTDATVAEPGSQRKPRIALALATALGVGYLPKAPGTFGSLVGLATAFLSAFFFLPPTSFGDLLSTHPLSDVFLNPGLRIDNTAAGLLIFAVLLVLTFLVAVGVWSAGRAAEYARQEDPQFVVIDEVAGQHLTLVLPLIPIALPHLTGRMDLSQYAIFSALSLVNWKYLLLGFILFRIFDIWKPFPIRRLEKLPGGWGIMADDWLAGVYAAILLRLALHFNLV